MRFMLRFFTRWGDFRGRAHKEEFRGVTITWMICAIFLTSFLNRNSPGGPSLIFWLTAPLLMIPIWAAAVRRYHDVKQYPAVWYEYILAIFLVHVHWDGIPGPNPYGPDPREEDGLDQTW